MILSVEGLEKKLGKKRVLKGINLSIDTSQCLALVGINGAGKSTLINCILNIHSPDKGRIKVCELDSANDHIGVKKTVGVVADCNPLIQEFTVNQYLKFIGVLHKLSPSEIESSIHDKVMFFFENKRILSENIHTLSTGNKSRVKLCAATLHKPKLLILDEPFSSLDIFAAKKLILFLKDYLNQKSSILLTSHNTNFMAKVATHISVLANGKICVYGSIENILSREDMLIDDLLVE